MSHLTPEQAAIIKPALLADPALAQYIADYRDDLIRDYYNSAATPVFYLWKNRVLRDDLMKEGFDFTQVDNLTNGQARIWDWLFDNAERAVNPSDAGKRAGISEAWKGTAAKVAVATYVLGQCKRQATRAEKLLAVGNGALATPAVVSGDILLDTSDVSAMLSGER